MNCVISTRFTLKGVQWDVSGKISERCLRQTPFDVGGKVKVIVVRTIEMDNCNERLRRLLFRSSRESQGVMDQCLEGIG